LVTLSDYNIQKSFISVEVCRFSSTKTFSDHKFRRNRLPPCHSFLWRYVHCHRKMCQCLNTTFRRSLLSTLFFVVEKITQRRLHPLSSSFIFAEVSRSSSKNASVSEYNIQKESTLHLVLRRQANLCQQASQGWSHPLLVVHLCGSLSAVSTISRRSRHSTLSFVFVEAFRTNKLRMITISLLVLHLCGGSM